MTSSAARIKSRTFLPRPAPVSTSTISAIFSQAASLSNRHCLSFGEKSNARSIAEPPEM